MKPHTFLRTASKAMPGLLLTGWAPGREATPSIQVVVREQRRRDAAPAIHHGVDFGVDDLARCAQGLHLPVTVLRVRGDHPEVGSLDPGAVQVIVATEDDGVAAHGDQAWGPRIYTCPLRRWRPDAWSVASPLVAAPGGPRLDWHPALTTPDAVQLCARFSRFSGTAMDEGAWRGWMAVKVAVSVALRAEAGEQDVLALHFDGHKGAPLHFSEDGHLVQPTVRFVDGRAEFAAPVDHDLADGDD